MVIYRLCTINAYKCVYTQANKQLQYQRHQMWSSHQCTIDGIDVWLAKSTTTIVKPTFKFSSIN